MPAGSVVNSSDFVVGVVARGRRTTTTGAITTTELGVLRVDNIPVVAGRLYKIAVGGVNMDASANANDIATCRIRVSTIGAATITSTQIGQIRNTIDDPTTSNILAGNFWFPAAASGTLSVLLSCARITGTDNITVFCSGTDILDMVVSCEGTDPGDSGVVI